MSSVGPVRVHIWACGSVDPCRPLTGSHGEVRPLTIVQALYLSHTGTVRGFATGPALAIMTGYGQLAHRHIFLSSFILDLVCFLLLLFFWGVFVFFSFSFPFFFFFFLLFWQKKKLATCIFCMIEFMLLSSTGTYIDK